jgi:phosphate starvation-inducible PhoH-like protein
MARRPAKKAAARAKRKEQKQEKQAQNIHVPLDIEWRTDTQKRAWHTLNRKLLTFLLGSAGSGKTFLAMAYAINAVLTQQCEKIVLTRPIVEAGEKLGFLPGSFGEKVNPYMQPLYDVMESTVGLHGAKRDYLNKAVVLAPLCYMRGRTFNNAICIFDEAQNATYAQLKLFLSRFGKDTQVIVTGDPQQSDLFHRDVPLMNVVDRVGDLDSVGVVRFDNSDVVRHPLVAELLNRL